MKQAIYIMMMVCAMGVSQAQEMQVRKVDSVNWQILNIQRYERGAYTVQGSPYMDSLTAISQIFAIADKRRAVIDAKVDEREFNSVDTILQKITGESYEITYRKKLQEALNGEWVVIGKGAKGDSTLITIKGRTVNVNGVLDIVSKKEFTITGVFAQTAVFNITDAGIVGVIGGRKAMMIKREPIPASQNRKQ